MAKLFDYFLKSDIPLLIAVFLIIFLLRLPWAGHIVIDWDESVYFTVSQDIVHDGSLYQTTWDGKGPLLFFILVPVIKLFGANIFALRIFTTMYVILSMLFIYLIVKTVVKTKASVLAPLCYGMFFMKFGGLASNRELFMMLPAIIATFFFFKYIESEFTGEWKLFFCGIFSAAAVLTVQTAFFSVAIFPATLALRKLTSRDYLWKSFARDILWYSAGAFILSAVVLLYFIVHNSLYDFYFAFYGYNQKHMSGISIQTGLQRLWEFLKLEGFSDLITVLGLVGVVLCYARSKIKKQKFMTNFLFGLFLFSLIGVFWARNMFGHYYLQMSLPFSIMISFAVSLLPLNRLELNKIIYSVVLAVIAITLSFNILVMLYLGIFILLLMLATDEHQIKTFNGVVCITIIILIFYSASSISNILSQPKNENDELIKVSALVANHTLSNDTIFVLGGEPVIYFLADRRPAVKYFVWYYYRDLLDSMGMTMNETLSELRNKKPEYFVYHNEQGPEVPALEKFMFNNYQAEERFGHYVLYRINESRFVT